LEVYIGNRIQSKYDEARKWSITFISRLNTAKIVFLKWIKSPGNIESVGKGGQLIGIAEVVPSVTDWIRICFAS